MIITENREVNGREFVYTYSDENMMIERDGILYAEAYDPIGLDRVYVETNIPILIESELETLHTTHENI